MNRKNVNNTIEKENADVFEQIQKIKDKIKLKERCRQSFSEQTKEMQQANERTIQLKRCENQELREKYRKSLNDEHAGSILQLFNSRPKAEGLAIKRKTIKEVTEELNQTVCELQKTHNKIVHIKNCKTKTLQNLKNVKPTQVTTFGNSASRGRQLENSLDKVKLKNVTAKNVKDVYLKLKMTLENELRFFPKKLNELEKEQMEIEQEMIYMKSVHEAATGEATEVVREKGIFENDVREARRQRDINLRQLRRSVRDMERKIEENVHHQHNLALTRKIAKVSSKEILRVATVQKLMSERMKKIDNYKKQADMIENITGISFTNLKEIIHCLSKQKRSAADLEDSAVSKVETLSKMNKKKEKLENILNEILYESDQVVQRKIDIANMKLNKLDKKTEKQSNLLANGNRVADSVITCCGAMLSHLQRSTEQLKVGIPKLKQTFLSESTKQDIFNASMNVVMIVHDKAKERMSSCGITEDDMFDDPILSLDQHSYINSHNNRIPGQLERQISEEFDNYNVPNNELYVSREMIKDFTSRVTLNSNRR